MMRLAHLLRRTNNNLILEATRGPKKKKGEAEVVIQSNDIINIFKDRTDPVIKDIREYPIFVQELSITHNTFHEFVAGIEQNLPERMPHEASYNSYLKSLKRQRVIAIGKFKHMDRHPDIHNEDRDIESRNSVYMVGKLDKDETVQTETEDDDEDDDE